MATPLQKGITKLRIIESRKTITLGPEFPEKIRVVTRPDIVVHGSMTGTVEWLNIHNVSKFILYPIVGPDKISCEFKNELRERVITAVDRYVKVAGEMRYRTGNNFPYEILVNDIEIFPTEDKIPTLYELRGIAPNATGEMSSVEFINYLRDKNSEER